MPLITNVMGSSGEELARLVEACDERPEIAAIELNVSCPNVKTGLDIGADPKQLEAVVRGLRDRTAKPLIVKLTPNTADVAACAPGAQEGGADAVSLINTLRATALAPEARRSGRRERAGWEVAPAGSRGRRSGRRAGPSRSCGRACRNPGGRNGRRSERSARTRSARRGGHAGRNRHRELPTTAMGARRRVAAGLL